MCHVQPQSSKLRNYSFTTFICFVRFDESSCFASDICSQSSCILFLSFTRSFETLFLGVYSTEWFGKANHGSLCIQVNIPISFNASMKISLQCKSFFILLLFFRIQVLYETPSHGNIQFKLSAWLFLFILTFPFSLSLSLSLSRCEWRKNICPNLHIHEHKQFSHLHLRHNSISFCVVCLD